MPTRTRCLLFTITAVATVARMAAAQPTPAASEVAAGPAHPDHRRRSPGPGRPAAQRPAVLRARQRGAARPCRTAAGGQRRLGARGRRPARAGAFRRAHGVQRHRALSRTGHRRLHPVARDAVRRARQRPHQLRRDGLSAPDSDRQPRRRRSIAADHGGLGAQRLVRARGDRERARRRPRRVAARPRRRVAPARCADADPAEGRAVCRPLADRPARRSSRTSARPACGSSTPTGIART